MTLIPFEEKPRLPGTLSIWCQAIHLEYGHTLPKCPFRQDFNFILFVIHIKFDSCVCYVVYYKASFSFDIEIKVSNITEDWQPDTTVLNDNDLLNPRFM